MQMFTQSWVSDGASTLLAAAQHVLDLYRSAPFLSVHDPPLTSTTLYGSTTGGLDLPLFSTLQQQLPASPAVLVEAAAVVAAATGDAMAVGLVLHGVSAIQRGHLEYPGDIVSLECLR
jgi:hypothetical protein